MCKELGICIALDTTGLADWSIIEESLKYVDLVLYDIKHLDPIKHKEWTGVDNRIILENVVKVAQMVRTWFRVPVIPGFNDAEFDLKEIVKMAGNCGAEKVSLLPYHRLGMSKYAGLGKRYELKDLREHDEKFFSHLKHSLEFEGVEIAISD
jgi:pyruvate formate lyase activating enzyme